MFFLSVIKFCKFFLSVVSFDTLTANVLGIGEVGAFKEQMINLAQMLIEIPILKFSTSSPILSIEVSLCKNNITHWILIFPLASSPATFILLFGEKLATPDNYTANQKNHAFLRWRCGLYFNTYSQLLFSELKFRYVLSLLM
jgi:hypothetical protein